MKPPKPRGMKNQQNSVVRVYVPEDAPGHVSVNGHVIPGSTLRVFNIQFGQPDQIEIVIAGHAGEKRNDRFLIALEHVDDSTGEEYQSFAAEKELEDGRKIIIETEDPFEAITYEKLQDAQAALEHLQYFDADIAGWSARTFGAVYVHEYWCNPATGEPIIDDREFKQRLMSLDNWLDAEEARYG